MWTDREIEEAIRIAFARLGYSSVKSEQLEAAREFVKGKDVFVALPTGAGKSLCYGCLPVVFDILRQNDSDTKSVAVVVSPLKALMLDQTQSFMAKGVDSVYVAVAIREVERVRRFRVSEIWLRQRSQDTLWLLFAIFFALYETGCSCHGASRFFTHLRIN